MKTSLEDKRKEIFDLHQSWLRPDVPLMRKSVPSPTPKNENKQAQKEVQTDTPTSKRNWVIITVVSITVILVLLELLFFASELGWFK